MKGLAVQRSAGRRPLEGTGPLEIPSIVSLPRITLGELAYDNLREAILTTRLLPGTPISENELSAAIGVSRTPVREAIRRLSEERLVEVTPQYGTIVSRIDAARARQAVFVRQSIECEALRAKNRFTAAELEILEREIERHLAAIKAGDSIASAALDDAFHATMMQICGYPEATIAVRAVSADIARILFLSGTHENYYASVAEDHSRLTELLRARKIGAAVELLRRHIGGFAIDQDELRLQKSEYFAAE